MNHRSPDTKERCPNGVATITAPSRAYRQPDPRPVRITRSGDRIKVTFPVAITLPPEICQQPGRKSKVWTFPLTAEWFAAVQKGWGRYAVTDRSLHYLTERF